MAGNNKKMIDVVGTKKLTTPEDELKMMTLEQWRRLGRTPAEHADKVSEKLDILGEESILRQQTGRENWRQSPLFRLYQAIGRRAIVDGRSLAAVVGDFQVTEEEYRALLALNGKI